MSRVSGDLEMHSSKPTHWKHSHTQHLDKGKPESFMFGSDSPEVIALGTHCYLNRHPLVSSTQNGALSCLLSSKWKLIHFQVRQLGQMFLSAFWNAFWKVSKRKEFASVENKIIPFSTDLISESTWFYSLRYTSPLSKWGYSERKECSPHG